MSLSTLPTHLLDPSGSRLLKPRKEGITMVMDKGLGLTEYTDLLTLSSDYIDYLKLGFGTLLLYPESVLREKIEQANHHGIKIYPGGTMTEIAITQNQLSIYLRYISDLGFDCVEISEGMIELDAGLRTLIIKKALEMGLEVITEYGKKEAGSRLDLAALEERLATDLEMGVSYVIVEGRESGENVGIYDQQGNFDADLILQFFSHSSLSQHLIWEAPHKKQQAKLIQLFGANVNLGNISPAETVALEALRRGLRSDTFLAKRG